mgnify:CR=1 FL=1
MPLTPNQVSLLSFLLAAFSSALYVARLPVLAGVLVQLSSVIDGVDGELARAKNMASPVGAFIDSVLDRLADSLIIVGLVIPVYDELGLGGLLLGFAALLGSLMVSYLHSQGIANLGVHLSRVGRVPMYASRDVRLFLVFLGSLLGTYVETLLVLVAVTLSYVFLKTLDVYLTFRGRRALA